MNRTELIDAIAEQAELTKAVASRALDALLDSIAGSLQNGDPVVLVNFGTFIVKDRAARKGRNPVTGEEININAAKVVGFKAGKGLKEAVKETAKN
jgi:DNA-binding protein HU-beta